MRTDRCLDDSAHEECLYWINGRVISVATKKYQYIGLQRYFSSGMFRSLTDIWSACCFLFWYIYLIAITYRLVLNVLVSINVQILITLIPTLFLLSNSSLSLPLSLSLSLSLSLCCSCLVFVPSLSQRRDHWGVRSCIRQINTFHTHTHTHTHKYPYNTYHRLISPPTLTNTPSPLHTLIILIHRSYKLPYHSPLTPTHPPNTHKHIQPHPHTRAYKHTYTNKPSCSTQ